MSDIKLVVVGGDFTADIALLGADLETEQGMDTAIVISLFSDARAGDDDALPQEGADRRGWWGDAYAETPGDVTGSKLWLLSRAKQTADVLVDAKQYAEAALAWLVEDKVASAVSVEASFPQKGWLGLAVEIARPTGPARERFDYLWRFQ